MTVAQPIPDDRLSACLSVLYTACVRARLLGYEGETDGLPADRCCMLADLMDAVHNIPEFLTRWPSCDESLLRAMLEEFDTKWASAGSGLLAAFDRGVLSGQPHP